LFRLDDQTAVITGAASGIGKATACLFAAAGARVVIGDLNGEATEATAAELTETGSQALGVAADVAQESAVDALFAAPTDHFGAIDVLVNNAAYRAKADFMEMSLAEWDGMLAVCTRGTIPVHARRDSQHAPHGTGSRDRQHLVG
jgi:NAD(P)-dependent dehydrogenase (short-subunit alcohol dehydrogenase family)